MPALGICLRVSLLTRHMQHLQQIVPHCCVCLPLVTHTVLVALPETVVAHMTALTTQRFKYLHVC